MTICLVYIYITGFIFCILRKAVKGSLHILAYSPHHLIVAYVIEMFHDELFYPLLESNEENRNLKKKLLGE